MKGFRDYLLRADQTCRGVIYAPSKTFMSAVLATYWKQGLVNLPMHPPPCREATPPLHTPRLGVCLGVLSSLILLLLPTKQVGTPCAHKAAPSILDSSVVTRFIFYFFFISSTVLPCALPLEHKVDPIEMSILGWVTLEK